MNAGLNEFKGIVKKKKHGEEFLFIRAVDGTHFKHESGYFHEVGHMDAAESFDKVSIVNKNSDSTWAYRGKYGIGVAPASEFEANPECDAKKATVSQARNRGKMGVAVSGPQVGLGVELEVPNPCAKCLLSDVLVVNYLWVRLIA